MLRLEVFITVGVIEVSTRAGRGVERALGVVSIGLISGLVVTASCSWVGCIVGLVVSTAVLIITMMLLLLWMSRNLRRRLTMIMLPGLVTVLMRMRAMTLRRIKHIFSSICSLVFLLLLFLFLYLCLVFLMSFELGCTFFHNFLM